MFRFPHSLTFEWLFTEDKMESQAKFLSPWTLLQVWSTVFFSSKIKKQNQKKMIMGIEEIFEKMDNINGKMYLLLYLLLFSH